MVDLQKAMDGLLHDTRMKEWVMKQGLITREELQKHLQSLPDSKDDCVEVTLEDKPDFGD
ncbi:MAG TPA: hypothetical protein PKC28_16375 [Bdellovibrionales bacterium]|nr:hypothetical protein [Bdellovibrionales bacterium]